MSGTAAALVCSELCNGVAVKYMNSYHAATETAGVPPRLKFVQSDESLIGN